ncbi:MAG: type I DNA topoisomerase [Bacteroidia bacterium]|nr:type I DNA topoisomerase [Bacteroidia bacterium]
MENLIIVESPTKAKTFQNYLGNDFTIKASYGHIRDLQDKKLSIDIEKGFTPEYVIPADKKKTVEDLKKAAAKADMVWLASDEDREGEAISWHLCEALGLDPKTTKRIVFHEITKNAIQSALQNPRTIDMNLVNAQQARRILDRLVGYELSPILWRKFMPNLSAGRVQSVALRLVVDREKEIIAFNNEKYYKVEASFHPEGTPSAIKVKASLDTRFNTEEEARKFLEDCIDARFSVCSLDSKETSRYPAAPFTTSTLQQEAAHKLHLPVSVTMRLAQGLYERGLITYMRTDSTNLSSLALGTTKKFITENFGTEYAHPRQFQTKSKGAQEAHEAIRPTFIENTEINGTAQEQKLYNLIWKRTVASQMADAKLLSTNIKVHSDKRNETFCIQASQVLFDGFLKLYIESNDDDSIADESTTILPPIKVGDIMESKGISASAKFTQAPARYSEATLVKKLEELGIGRPSTYGPTIGKLTTDRGYIVKGDKEGKKVTVTNLTLKNGTITSSEKTEVIGAEKGKLLPQEIGMLTTDYLVNNFPTILDYDFTASVEEDFDRIAEGEKEWSGVIGDFYGPFHNKVEESMADKNYSRISRELGVDPADGQMIVARFGQFGPYVQKGDGENRQYASLGKGQLIETITLAEALNLFQLPRNAGRFEDIDIIITKGRFGPYIKFGGTNISLPRGTDPLKVSLEDCIRIIEATRDKTANSGILKVFEDSDIQIINGRYGPYIKHAGSNFRIPKDKDASTLTEEDCKDIINNTKPTEKTFRRGRKK